MPFPLPLNLEYRKLLIRDWIQDAEDRLEMGLPDDAAISWQVANALYLSLPPGKGSSDIEEDLVNCRVKLDRHTQ